MTICAKCGEEFPEKYRFCPECGLSVVSGIEGEGTGLKKVTNDESGMTNGEGERRTDLSMGFEKTLVSATPHSPFRNPHSEAEELSARYELLEEIGRGGFARVWRARDRKLDRMVAIKRLLPERVTALEDGGKSLERFRREAVAIAALNHRNIVQVFDHDADGEGHYVVMEYVAGGSVRDRLKEKGKLDPEEAVGLIKGVAQGLAYAHKKNLVHRDIKPGNILLERAGGSAEGGLEPKIVDFGLARVGTDSELSMTGYGMGTPYYMPPEQRRDAKGVNHTADIYALGKTLYEMLTGEVPDQVDPEMVPPGLAKVILKCVKNNPEDRYFSAEELLADLEALSGRRSGSRVSGASEMESDSCCPSCGAVNPPDAKFCESCGVGLFKACPECGRENSVRKVYCGGCGTHLTAFTEVEEILGRMGKYAGGKKWSRVVKEYGLLPDTARLRGAKAQELLKQVDALINTSKSKQKERDVLNGEIQGLLEGKKYEEAEKAIRASLELDAEQKDLLALRAQLPELITKRETAERRRERDGVNQEIRKRLEREEYEEIRPLLEQSLKLDPHQAEWRELLSGLRGKIQDRELRKRKLEVERYNRSAIAAMERQDYTAATDCCKRSLELIPQQPEIRKLLESIPGKIAAKQQEENLKKARVLKEEIRKWMNPEGAGRVPGLLQELRALTPFDEEIKKLEQRLDEILFQVKWDGILREYRGEDVTLQQRMTLLESARSYVLANEHVQICGKAKGELAALEEELQEELWAEIQEIAKGFEWTKAVALAHEAARVFRDAPSFLELAENLKRQWADYNDTQAQVNARVAEGKYYAAEALLKEGLLRFPGAPELINKRGELIKLVVRKQTFWAEIFITIILLILFDQVTKTELTWQVSFSILLMLFLMYLIYSLLRFVLIKIHKAVAVLVGLAFAFYVFPSAHWHFVVTIILFEAVKWLRLLLLRPIFMKRALRKYCFESDEPKLCEAL